MTDITRYSPPSPETTSRRLLLIAAALGVIALAFSIWNGMRKGHWDWGPNLNTLGILTAVIANIIYRDRERLLRILMAIALVLIVLGFILILRV